ncbi:MAG TPA: Flp pilus assembly protein CpaB [Gemmatimonadaceae bacterium]|nr:Flp pilus assembly protein CpaB [Gemmatimonadaceae bacterium]
MADRRYTLMFYVAIAVAAIATWGVYRVLQETKARSHVATMPVLVASRDLPEGASIDRLAVETNPWPSPTVPPGAFNSVDSVLGRVTRVPIFKGEPIVPGRLAPVGTGPGLEVKITPGKRAMAVRIDDVAGLSGLIQPNSRVDVLVTLRDVATNVRQVSKVFMENMRVLSVGTQIQRGNDGRPINATTATLEVTPDEAERLALAMSQGSIQLVLRGYGDPDSIQTRGATSNDVLSQLKLAQPAAAAPAPRPRPLRVAPAAPNTVVVQLPPRRPDSSVVEIFRGTERKEQRVPKDTSRTGRSP